MGLLYWLLSEFGGWLAVGLGLITAWFGLQWRGEQKGRAEARQQQEIADATAIKDRSRGDDAVRRAGAGAARKQLRNDWKGRELRRVDDDRG